MAPINQPLAKELLQMAAADQEMTTKAISGKASWDLSIDQANERRLNEIINTYGWPTISKVGKEASQAAWLLAQHAPSLEFMEHCLDIMEQLPPGEINPANVALLKDRVLILKGQPQIYGTQFERVGQEIRAYPIQDPDRIDELRASVGLNTFAENEANIRRFRS